MASATTSGFLDALEKSGLLTAAAVAQARDWVEADDGAATDGDAVAKRLIAERLITRFQAKQLLAGRHRGFFIAEKYKILELLGEGGMGRVLLCEHMLLRRLVALKLMQGTERYASAVDRFLREARAAASLHHPNIAQVFDVDRSERGPYLVMEYIDGIDLHRLTSKIGPLPIERAVHYVRQAAAGLQHAHDAGLVHRDIKPLNVMLDRTGGIKLLDLGLARFFNAEQNDKLTQQHDVSAILGTADFIAPEQALESSTADIRADIYSLGLTFYFLLTGKLPFGPGKPIQKLLWQQVRDPEPILKVRPEIPDGLAGVLEQMIRKKPEERHATPAEVMAALEPWDCATVGPPTAEEMPPTLPSAYRLGISPVQKPGAAATSRVSVSDSGEVSGVLGGSTADPKLRPLPERRDQPNGPMSDVRPVSESPAAETPNRGAGPTKLTAPAVPQVQTWMEAEMTSSVPAAAPNLLPPPRAARKVDRRRVALWAGGACGVVLLLGVCGIVTKLVLSRGEPTARASHGAAIAAPSGSAAPAVPATGLSLRGGGSTFVRPIIEHWSQRYRDSHGVQVDYVGVGSSKGIEGVTSKLLDFGCTDAYLSDQQLAEAGGRMLHVPLVLGAVVPTYNVPQESGGAPLRFTGPVLAQIYLGRIKNWNDPAIAVNNPGVKLPDLPIMPVYRSDGSGSTSIWTEYLAKASAEWKDQVGTGTKVKWPVGTGAEKSNGVADAVSRTTGGIGYVELSYALSNGLPVGQVKNAAGSFVTPSIDSVTAAAVASLHSIPADMRYSLTDAPGAASYPIAGTSWALLYADQPYGKGKELAEFLKWATSDGQAYVGDLHYGRLPPELAALVRKSLDDLTAGR